MRLPGNLWVLGGVLVAAGVGGYLLLRRRGPVTPNYAGGAPIAPPSVSPSQLGLEFGGLQDQIGNLAAQISAGFAGPHNQQQPPNAIGNPCIDPRSGSSIIGCLPGPPGPAVEFPGPPTRFPSQTAVGA